MKMTGNYINNFADIANDNHILIKAILVDAEEFDQKSQEITLLEKGDAILHEHETIANKFAARKIIENMKGNPFHIIIQDDNPKYVNNVKNILIERLEELTFKYFDEPMIWFPNSIETETGKDNFLGLSEKHNYRIAEKLTIFDNIDYEKEEAILKDFKDFFQYASNRANQYMSNLNNKWNNFMNKFSISICEDPDIDNDKAETVILQRGQSSYNKIAEKEFELCNIVNEIILSLPNKAEERINNMITEDEYQMDLLSRRTAIDIIIGDKTIIIGKDTDIPQEENDTIDKQIVDNAFDILKNVGYSLSPSQEDDWLHEVYDDEALIKKQKKNYLHSDPKLNDRNGSIQHYNLIDIIKDNIMGIVNEGNLYQRGIYNNAILSARNIFEEQPDQIEDDIDKIVYNPAFSAEDDKEKVKSDFYKQRAELLLYASIMQDRNDGEGFPKGDTLFDGKIFTT